MLLKNTAERKPGKDEQSRYETHNSQVIQVIDTGYYTVNLKPFIHSLHIFHNLSILSPELLFSFPVLHASVTNGTKENI